MFVVHEIKQTGFKDDITMTELQVSYSTNERFNEERTEIDTNLGSLSPKNASISKQMVRQI